MQSKIDRVMCGICIYWNGNRERLDNDSKVVFFDDTAWVPCQFQVRRIKKKRAEMQVLFKFTEKLMIGERDCEKIIIYYCFAVSFRICRSILW
jgi:hypothetical protein